jgi:hypothetical protein
MTAITDEAEGAGRSRAALLAGLHNLIDALPAMDEAGIPDRLSFQLPVPDGLDHEQKLAWVDRVAAAWGVRPVDNTMGRHAEKAFGGVRLTASVGRPDRGFSDLQARAAAHALRSSIASNGLGATA